MTVLTARFFSCHLSMSGIHLFLYFYRSIPVLVVHFCNYSFCIRICPVLLHLFVFEYVLASSIVLLISVRLSVSASAFNIFALVFTILFASVFIALAIYLFFFSLITLGLFWPGDGVLTSCHDNVSEIKPTP